MKTDLRITNRDTKISYNKVLIKSDLQVKIIYLTEENRINMKEATIPIVGFVDLPNISEEHNCNVKYEMKNVIIKPNNVEEHSIYIEAEIDVYCEAYVDMMKDYRTKGFSPLIKRRFVIGSYVLQKENQELKKQVCNVREKQVIPEIGSHQIYDVEVTPIIEGQTILNNRIVYDGDIKLNFIFEGTGGINTKEISVPFSFTMDFDGINTDRNIDTVIEIESQNFIVMPDESIDIRIDLGFTAISGRDGSIAIIDDVTEEENRELSKYSMVIYFVKPNDTIWNIAKRFGSTVDDIVRVNGIENPENIQVGKQLFIPRYHE